MIERLSERRPIASRPSFVAFISGVFVSVLTALGVVFAACTNKLPDDRRRSGTGGEVQSSGGSAGVANDSDSGSQNGHGGSAQNGTAAAGGVSSLPYSPSCAEQVCTSDEKCADGPAGTYCVHACPGQFCSSGDGPVPYCTRNGGVICLAQ